MLSTSASPSGAQNTSVSNPRPDYETMGEAHKVATPLDKVLATSQEKSLANRLPQVPTQPLKSHVENAFFQLITPWPETPDDEPVSITKLAGRGENFLAAVSRVSNRMGDHEAVGTSSSTWLPGMKVSQDQVGIQLKNGRVRFLGAGAYLTTLVQPLKKSLEVVPVERNDGVEFNPLARAVGAADGQATIYGDSYRQLIVAPHQIAVFHEDGETTLREGGSTYVYGPGTQLRGVISMNKLATQIEVMRETEDTTDIIRQEVRDQRVAQQRGGQHGDHGSQIQTQQRKIVAGTAQKVGGIEFVRPSPGFVSLIRTNGNDAITTSTGLMAAVNGAEFVKCNGVIEFGDLNDYAKSSPKWTFQSKDKYNVDVRAQIKWRQIKPEIWVERRGAFVDPFDALEEPCMNRLRDWLQSVNHDQALEAQTKGFENEENRLVSQLQDIADQYGVQVVSLEITTLKFPDIDAENYKISLQKAEAQLEINKLQNQAYLAKQQQLTASEEHNKSMQGLELKAKGNEKTAEVDQRKNTNAAHTVKSKAEAESTAVEAERTLELARVTKTNDVQMAQIEAQAAREKVKGETAMNVAQFQAEGDVATIKEKYKADIDALTQKAALIKANPQLLELLRLESQADVQKSYASAAASNPNVSLGLTEEHAQQIRRMNGGFAPLQAQVIPVGATAINAQQQAANEV